MKPLISDRLAIALLAEMSNGRWEPGIRFLSQRQIKRYWRVSTESVCMALDCLAKYGLLRKRPRRGHYLQADFRLKALSLLNESTLPPLPRQARWQSRFWLKTIASDPNKRIAVIMMIRTFDIKGDKVGLAEEYRAAMRLDMPSSRTVMGIERAARFTNTGVDLYACNGSKEAMQTLSAHILKSKVQGVIIVHRMMEIDVSPLATVLLSKGMPVVTAYADTEKTDMMAVNFNNVGIGYTAAQIFMHNGHRRIGVLNLRNQASEYFDDRLKGCQLAVQQAGLSKEQVISLPLAHDNQEEIAAMVDFLCTPAAPTAILATHTFVITALAEELRSRGKEIPRDLAVIVCSSTPHIEGFSFPLDVMLLDFRKIGVRAFKSLTRLINGLNDSPYPLVRVNYQRNGTIDHIGSKSRNGSAREKCEVRN